MRCRREDRVFFYPGSSLGNFQPAQALAFLRQMVDPAQGRARGLLLGIDLVKDAATLEAAYDDALGVTAAFNKNLLLHVNALLATDFNVRQWRHVALFNAAQSRIEMHLEALCDLTVQLAWPVAPLSGGRADSHRKLVQIHGRKHDGPAAASGFSRTSSTGATRRTGLPCSGRRFRPAGLFLQGK